MDEGIKVSCVFEAEGQMDGTFFDRRSGLHWPTTVPYLI
jgi:hypothetical protein